MIEHVITGGQTGVEQAAWRVAKRWGYKTSGMMPKGFITGDGKRPDFAEIYGSKESRSVNNRPCIQTNAQNSDAVLWLGPIDSPAYMETLKECSHTNPGCTERTQHSLSRRFIFVEDMEARMKLSYDIRLGLIPTRDLLIGIKTVCISGPSESNYLGIGELAERFLDTVFQMIKDKVNRDQLKKELDEEEEIEEPLEEDLEQLDQEYREAASRRMSPPLELPNQWRPGEPY